MVFLATMLQGRPRKEDMEMMSIACNPFDPANNMIAVVATQLQRAEVELFRTSWRVYYDAYNTILVPSPSIRPSPTVVVTEHVAHTNAPWCVGCLWRRVWDARRQVHCRGKGVGSSSSMATLGGSSAASLAVRGEETSRGCNKRISGERCATYVILASLQRQ